MTWSADDLSAMADGGRRRELAEAALALPLPSAEAEEWRYSPVGDLDLDRYQPQVTPPTATRPATGLVSDPAAMVIVVNGWVTEVSVDPGWAAKGLEVGPAWDTASRQLAVSPDTAIDHLHLAYAPDAVRIVVSAGLIVDRPVLVVVHHTGDGVAAFPHIRVSVGEGAQATVIEQQTSGPGDGLSVPLTELDVGRSAQLWYGTIQELGPELVQLGRQVTSVADQGTATGAVAAFGGRYARLRFDTDLVGRRSVGNLLAAYYGDDDQVLDFRTFQHHRGPDTSSDLLFKGTVDDRAGSIYTGLIRIHPDGRGSDAHQTNRNIKLADDAWAWSVPNLEIENNDVRCSHASTVSPVDADQRFYLHARGVPPIVADRLIVAGFFAEVIERFPVPEVRDHVRALIAAKLDERAT